MLMSQFRCTGRAPATAVLWVALAVFASRTARAQTPEVPAEDDADRSAPPEPLPEINLTDPPPPSRGPIIDLSTPAPGARVLRTYHQHDGFYVRVDGGLGTLLSANVDTNLGDRSADGVSLSYDLLIGGSPGPGFAVGGGLVGSLQLSGDWETRSGVPADGGNLTTLIIGPFADGFPDPKGGWHLGGLAGLAWAGFDMPVSGDGTSAIGFGGAFWTGYDVWVAPDWSVGGLLRMDALRATNSDDDATVSQVALSLMFSVLYH